MGPSDLSYPSPLCDNLCRYTYPSSRGVATLGLWLQKVCSGCVWRSCYHLYCPFRSQKCSRLDSLFHTTHRVKNQHRGQWCGDIELAVYLANASGPVPLVMDLRITHERFGSRSDPSFNGHLHYPHDLDRTLNEVAADKIREYRAVSSPDSWRGEGRKLKTRRRSDTNLKTRRGGLNTSWHRSISSGRRLSKCDICTIMWHWLWILSDHRSVPRVCVALEGHRVRENDTRVDYVWWKTYFDCVVVGHPIDKNLISTINKNDNW